MTPGFNKTIEITRDYYEYIESHYEAILYVYYKCRLTIIEVNALGYVWKFIDIALCVPWPTTYFPI